MGPLVSSRGRTGIRSRFRQLEVDDVDRQLLRALDERPSSSFRELAETIGMSERTVARRYQRLNNAGIVAIRGRTLPGIDGGHVWLIKARIDPPAAVEVAQQLSQWDSSRWVRLSTDRTELTCGLVMSRNQDHVVDALSRIPGLRSLNYYELLEVYTRSPSAPSSLEPLDDIDRSVVTYLARDGRASVAEIARAIGKDASVVSRRRQQLIESGRIYFEADIHPDALSASADVMIWLDVVPGHIREVGKRLRSLDACRFAAACTGGPTVVANLVSESPATLVQLIDDVLVDCGVCGCDIARLGMTFKRTSPIPG